MRSRLRRLAALLVIGTALGACSVSTTATLPAEFPADFPTPPSAKLLTATGPLPFVPVEARGMTAQWSSSLSKDELTAFYARPHGAWVPYRSAIEGPGAGPITLGTMLFLTHTADGIFASISVGMTNPIDKGTLVQVTILPAPPSASPVPR